MLGKQPIFTIHAELETITSLGRTPYGERRVIGILGGKVSGPKLNGRILPGGADWQIIRSDGAADIKARYTIETEAGALHHGHQRRSAARPARRYGEADARRQCRPPLITISAP